MQQRNSQHDRRVPTSAGIERLADLVAAIASVEAAALVTVIATIWAREGRTEIPIRELAQAASLGNDPDEAAATLDRIERSLPGVLDLRRVGEPNPQFVIREAFCSNGRDDAAAETTSIRFSTSLQELLTPPPEPTGLREAPIVDDKTAMWIDAVRAASNAGAAVHLAMRCLRDDAREFEDLARLLRQAGVPSHRIAGPPGEILARLLRAVLHRHDNAIVLVEPSCLVTAAPSAPDDEWTWEEPDAGARRPGGWQTTAFADDALSWIDKLRGVHVWRIPAAASIPKGLDTFIGGAIGPIEYDLAWRREVVRRRVPGLGDAGADALLAHSGDPRDVGAMARAVTWLTHDGRSLDEAAMAIAGSMSNMPIASAATMPTPRNFDRRLLVCDEDALILLDRAQAAAKDGARVLCWGPPGGGKSTYVQALAAQMASESKPKRNVVVVTPALILARGLGVTERIMEAIWSRAAASGGILVVDEIDAMCGVRDPDGASSGNAYLVRTLTDQWLRCFDLHPNVSVLATCNDPRAVDPAARRRFALMLEFGDELPPERERLAWRVIAEIEPPSGWRPCRASVADIASATRSCRMLGHQTPDLLAKAIVRARLARQGPQADVRIRAALRKRNVH